MLRFPRKTLSIDFGSKQIKIIEGKCTKDYIQILKSLTIELPPDYYVNGRILDERALGTLIKKTLSSNKIRTAMTHGIINSSEILIREIIIPKVPHDEIKSVVSYQISDYLPVAIEDYVVQYLTQGTMFDGEVERIKVLLLAIPKDMVLSHLALLKSIGLRPDVLDHQGNAMVKLLDFNAMINRKKSLENLAVASVDIGYNNSKITITKNGKMEVARTIDFGVQSLYNNMATFFDYSQDEVEEKLRNIKSLNSFQDEFSDESRFANIVRSSFTEFCEKLDATVRHYNTREVGNILEYILLQGGLSNIPEVDQVFFAYFNIPTTQLQSLDRIRWSGDLPKYANAIGGLVRTDVD